MRVLIAERSGNFGNVFALLDQATPVVHPKFTDVFEDADAEGSFEKRHQLVCVGAEVSCQARYRMIVEESLRKKFFKRLRYVPVATIRSCRTWVVFFLKKRMQLPKYDLDDGRLYHELSQLTRHRTIKNVLKQFMLLQADIGRCIA